MARKIKFSFEHYLKWLLIIPGAIGSLGFILSGMMIVPDHWREYKQLRNEHVQLVKKVYGASPDDMDGIRASVEREIEVDNIIEDAKLLIPITKKLFNVELPDIKSRIKKNEDDIKNIIK